MNKVQKELTARELKKEKEIINKLKETYAKAELELEDKIKLLEADDLTQSKIYQLEYQKALKGQIGAILDNMNANNYTTIHDYLKNCYEDGFIGTMYDLQSQGIPMIMPIDQDLVVKAIQIDSKISEGLYTKMGVDTKDLKKAITQEVSRSISNNYTYQETARNLSNQMRIGFNKAVRIARTEGHRIVQQSRMDGMHSAKNEGANIVKQWDSTLDRKTRPHHQQLDGQIRELDEPFEVNGKKGMYPGGFNVAAEDINCRCVVVQRAKWTLDEEELEELKERAAYFGLDKTKNFENFKEKYLKAINDPHRISEGKNILDEWVRRKSEFDFEIEDIMNAQGYDGLPRIVKASEFDEYVKESGFIAQRTYSANSQEVLDAYREELYHGKWYVDCSVGGAQYGQGMYCAADYTGKLTDGILSEMKHYQELNAERGNPLAFVETMTIDKSAKIIEHKKLKEMYDAYKTETFRNSLKSVLGEDYIRNAYSSIATAIEYEQKLKTCEFHEVKSIKSTISYYKKLTKEFHPDLYKKYNSLKKSVEKNFNETSIQDIGTYAAANGYDVINAKGHGDSGSYTVILNRTKVVIKDER